MAVKGEMNSATGNDVAYSGSLLFNPNNYSSIFHPAPGWWSYSLSAQGGSCNYWTQERLYAGNSSSLDMGLYLIASKDGFNINSGAGLEAFPKSIRCVKDYSLQSQIGMKNYD